MPLLPALLLSALGGLITNWAFPHNSWWFLAPIGLAALVYAIRGQRARRAFLLGFVWGMGLFVPLLYWSLHSVGQWVPWIALSALQALFVGAFAASSAVVDGRLARGGAVGTILLWVSFEQLRSVIPFGGFPWGLLAFSQTEGPLLPLAAVGGTVLVSGVVALIAVALALLARLRPSGLVAASLAVGMVVGGLLFPPALGAEEGTLKIAVVQGNVPERGAEALGVAREITANYADIVEREAPWDADLMVWPESAADIDPRTDASVEFDVRRAYQAVEIPLLLGTQRFTDDARYNEYILWGDGGATAAYAKQHPVPFGEYIPYRDFFRKLHSAVDRVSTDMAPGSEPAVMTVALNDGREIALGTAICFEVVYDGLIREAVELGAQALIIPTNNASFGYTEEARQQLAASRFRAVEHARSTIQVSTVGVSAVFGPDGSIIARSSDELYTEWTAVDEIPLRSSLTVATSLGDIPRIAVWALSVLWVAVAVFHRRAAS